MEREAQTYPEIFGDPTTVSPEEDVDAEIFEEIINQGHIDLIGVMIGRSLALTPEQTMEVRSRLRSEEYLGSFPERYREILILKYGLGGEIKSIKGIANELGIKESMVKHRLAMGEMKLRSRVIRGGLIEEIGITEDNYIEPDEAA